MTRVITQQWISLDRYASGPDGEEELFAQVDAGIDERSQQHNLEPIPSVDHVLLGRRTYEAFVTQWPTAPETIAGTVNAARKVVASRGLDEAPWPGYDAASVVPDAVDHVRRHRAAGGGDVLIWGRRR